MVFGLSSTTPALTISREKLFKQLDYEPHGKEQWDAHRAEQRFRVICAGRRFGKSQWAGHELTLKMFVPDSVNWVVGPDYSLGEKEFRVAWFDFKKLGLLDRCNKSYNVKQGNMRLYWKEMNSLLEVKSAKEGHKDGLVGEGLDHVCMSEAAKHQMSTWQMYIEPALSDKLGTADFPSTPQGFNWYKGLYELGQNTHRDDLEDYISWRFPTWVNTLKYPGGFDPVCPNIRANDSGQLMHSRYNKCSCNKELVRIFNNSSRMYWLQEYCAEFTAFEGMVYPEFNEMTHVRNFEYMPQWKNWMALDFGFVDPFICLDIMIDQEDRVYVWREYAVSYKTNHEHAQILKNRESPKGYHVDAIAADPRDPDAINTIAWALGGANATPVDRSAGYEVIRRHLKVREDGLPGLFIHPRCTELTRQIKTLRYAESREGHNAKQTEHDYDNHCTDALRYFFNEYFILGRNESLSDLYSGIGNRTEADTFFTYTSAITLDDDFRL